MLPPRPLTRRSLLLAGGAAGWLLTGCTVSGDPTQPSAAGSRSVDPEPPPVFDPARATLTYVFTDSSKAPDQQRSFTVTAGPGKSDEAQARIVVASGEGELHDESAVIDGAMWESVVSDMPMVMSDADRVSRTPCPGGTATAVTLEQPGLRWALEPIVSCDRQTRAAVDRLRTAIDPVLSAFDLDELLR